MRLQPIWRKEQKAKVRSLPPLQLNTLAARFLASCFLPSDKAYTRVPSFFDAKKTAHQNSLASIYLQNNTHVPFSSFTSLLKECAIAKALFEGRLLHGQTVRRSFDGDTFMGNLLIDMYGKCGSLIDARVTFNKMPSCNLFSWNILISAYTYNRCAEDAVKLFKLMLEKNMQPDKCTYASTLVACSILVDLPGGRHIHFAILNEGLDLDVYLASAIVNMYGKCGSLEDARGMFDTLSRKDGVTCKDGVTWSAMMTAYATHGWDMEALHLYQQMHHHGVKYEKVTFLTALGACSNLVILLHGKLIHANIVEQGLQSDLSISTALVSMYSNCGSLEDAQSVFGRMSQHDLVSWSAMISVNTQHGEDVEALLLFSQMHRDGMKPDRVSFVSIFSACANQAALAHGRLIHANIVEYGMDSDLAVGNALVNMYGKCGSLTDTKHVFDNMSTRNVISWTAMIEVQAYVGHAAEALELLFEMQEQDVSPNDVTFVNILSSCSHAGLIAEGCCLFKSMIQDYEIEITMEHYSSMIDLFGRAGRLAEAEFVISKMSIEPNAVIWETLLSACRVHNDVDRGKQAAGRAILLDSKVASPYVLLSNIYSAEGRWDDAAKIWKLMFERGMTSSQEREGSLEGFYDLSADLS